MRNPLIFVIIFILVTTTANAQVRLPNLMNKAANALSQGTPNQVEIVTGLKQTLDAGISAGSERLSASEGFLGNKSVKILFPPEAAKLEKTLRTAGMGKLCDDFIISVNNAAGQAVAQAKPIFVNALREMSFKDASSILLSKETDAATKYFEKVTTAALLDTFRPVIEQEISKTGATNYWSELVTHYNKLPLTSDIETDLASYVSKKAVAGLFHEIAKEELMIRRNTTMRSSPTMRKIWNYADRSQY